MPEMQFKRAKDDDFKAADPDTLMASVSRSDLGRTLALSAALHVAVILLLSLGNMGLCVKYRTLNLRSAIEQRDADAKEAVARRKAEEAAARRKELEKKNASHAEPVADSGTDQGGEGDEPAVIKETTAVSDLRPESSSLDSIDDLLEE